MKSQGNAGGGHGAARAGVSSVPQGAGEGEGKLRIHLKRSCTDRKVVQANTDFGLTTDDWQKFKKLLASKTFAAHDTKRISGEDLTAGWAGQSGFREPIIAPDKAGMGLTVPDSSFAVADVARVVGEDKAIRPIHVGEQANIDQSMTLAEFAEYFETCTKPGQAILNMISLEFSDTPLAELVQSPQLVRDIDWVNRCWPDDRKQQGEFPKVQYYCLMSQGGSYTDFHVDFGGTSVWYHILRGKKEFLLIRPTKANLELYEEWIRSPSQSQVFFGDLADTCYRVVLNAGETLMIPSGWIHAVFTPKPSLVFGGNFLHSHNIPMQLQIHDIEVRAKIHNKFRFPYFKEMNFFAASCFLRTLRQQQDKPEGDESATASAAIAVEDQPLPEQSEGGQPVPAVETSMRDSGAGGSLALSSWELDGLPALVEACRRWLTEEEGNGDHGDLPEEWQAAADLAGCPGIVAMLQELETRLSKVEQLGPRSRPNDSKLSEGVAGASLLAVPAAEDRSGVLFLADAAPASLGGDIDGVSSLAAAAKTLEAEEERDSAATGSHASVASNDTPGQEASMLLGTDGRGQREGEGEGRDAGKETGPSDASKGSSALTIPKLKISIKSLSPRPRERDQQARGSDSCGAAAGTKSGGGLKLVLKRSQGAAGTGAAVAGKKRARQHPRSASWADDGQEDSAGGEEEGDSSGEGDNSDDERDDDGEQDEEEDEDEDEDEEDDEDSGGEERIGRGGKRRARPLGSRLRAIARLGDDAAGGGSEDENSADEYKPDPEEDEGLPGDHKIKLDADDIRETKKARATPAGGTSGGAQRSKDSNRGKSNGEGGPAGKTWSARGAEGGGADSGTRGNGNGRGAGGTASLGGPRRIPVSKQEALRSKGLFKIAPQSKVPVQGKKDKKPLTAKQKLMAKMRR